MSILRSPAALLLVGPGLFLALSSAPIAWLAACLTLTGLYEESLGSGFFYTLLSLHEDIFLFIAARQLLHGMLETVHVTLSVLRFRPGEPFPHLDLL